VLDVVAGLDSAGRARFNETASRTGGEKLLVARLGRRIKRENYKYILE